MFALLSVRRDFYTDCFKIIDTEDYQTDTISSKEVQELLNKGYSIEGLKGDYLEHYCNESIMLSIVDDDILVLTNIHQNFVYVYYKHRRIKSITQVVYYTKSAEWDLGITLMNFVRINKDTIWLFFKTKLRNVYTLAELNLKTHEFVDYTHKWLPFRPSQTAYRVYTTGTKNLLPDISTTEFIWFYEETKENIYSYINAMSGDKMYCYAEDLHNNQWKPHLHSIYNPIVNYGNMHWNRQFMSVQQPIIIQRLKSAVDILKYVSIEVRQEILHSDMFTIYLNAMMRETLVTLAEKIGAAYVYLSKRIYAPSSQIRNGFEILFEAAPYTEIQREEGHAYVECILEIGVTIENKGNNVDIKFEVE